MTKFDLSNGNFIIIIAYYKYSYKKIINTIKAPLK